MKPLTKSRNNTKKNVAQIIIKYNFLSIIIVMNHEVYVGKIVIR